MTRPRPITPDRVLEEIEQATHLSQISIPASSLRMEEMLRDPNFAAKAQGLVASKIEDILEGKIQYAHSRGSKTRVRVLVLSGWQEFLDRITQSLEKDGTTERRSR